MAQVNIQKLQGGGAVKKYGNFTKDSVTSVSYTHLDVYKRQVFY